MGLIFDQFHTLGVIPVIEIDAAERILPLVQALGSGGLPVAEITLRTPAALDAIRLVARQEPHVLLGAGTVLNRAQAEKAVAAGAQYLVSPGLDEDLVRWAQENKIPLLAGAVTPTEMMHALKLNLSLLKFFFF